MKRKILAVALVFERTAACESFTCIFVGNFRSVLDEIPLVAINLIFLG